MERQQVEVFLTLVHELHFRRTADRLLLSQARVSQSIKRTEVEIGAALFRRTSRRVELTAIGKLLADGLAPAYAQLLDAIAEAAAAARRVHGRLTVGFLGPVAGDLIAQALTPFRAEHPDATIDLQEVEIADPVRPLRDRDVDLLLTQRPVGESGITGDGPLIVEPRVLAIATAHPLAKARTVTLDDLVDTRIFTPAGTPPAEWLNSYQPWTTDTGTPIERGPAVTTFGELLAMIAAGEGACTVAEHNTIYHARPGVAYVPIEGAPPFEFGFVWAAGTDTALTREVVAAVRPASTASADRHLSSLR